MVKYRLLIVLLVFISLWVYLNISLWITNKLPDFLIKVALLNNNAFVHYDGYKNNARGQNCHKGVLSVYYDKTCLKFASHHFLLYVVYMCQKSLNFTYALKYYHQKCSWPHFSWPTLYICRVLYLCLPDVRCASCGTWPGSWQSRSGRWWCRRLYRWNKDRRCSRATARDHRVSNRAASTGPSVDRPCRTASRRRRSEGRWRPETRWSSLSAGECCARWWTTKSRWGYRSPSRRSWSPLIDRVSRSAKPAIQHHVSK